MLNSSFFSALATALVIALAPISEASATLITATWRGTAINAAGSSPVLGTPQDGDTVVMRFTYDTSGLSGADVFHTSGLFQYTTFPTMYSLTTVSFGGGPAHVVDDDYLGLFFINDQQGQFREYYGNSASGSMEGGSTGDQFAVAALQRFTGPYSPTDANRLFSAEFSFDYDPDYFANGGFQLSDSSLNYIGAQVVFTSLTVSEGGQNSGETSVPAPPVIVLLMVGLAGLWAARRCTLGARNPRAAVRPVRRIVS